MAGYQFVHFECYGREESKKGRTQTKKNSDGTFSSKEVEKEKRGNVSWVIAEAKREPDSCYHIENPLPPIVLIGDLDNVEAEANQWAEQATDAKGRKLRKDAHCLLAGVISLPRSEEKNWEKFKAASIKWLKEKYGDNLRCVIEHQDEAHPHLHFYAIPKAGQSFDDIHEGKNAQREIKKQNPKATKQEQNIAFAEAMRATQDNFSRRVGQPFGLTRLGPGRRRLTRKAWKAEQKQAEALQQVEKTARKRHEFYKAQGLRVGFAQAEKEAKQPVKRLANHAKGFLKGVYEGLLSPTQAEQDAKRALEADDKRRDAEQARKEDEFKRREAELRATAEERFNNEKMMREQAEDALDFVLKVGGSELLLAVQQASKEREQAPQEALAKNAVGNEAKLVNKANLVKNNSKNRN